MLEPTFLGFINDNRLFTPTDRVLLAVSGGLDSMVMADLFHRTDQSFAIAHVNFNLRGDESDADALFVQNVARQYGVPFHLTRFDTVTVAAERGLSVQMAARDLRYGWFTELLKQHSYACVATAHHQNDVLETLLLNLIRGTGLAGLHGIAVRHESVIRPVLFATRDELAAYARDHALTYREDSSNTDDKYARNRIRHHVVPVLTALNPGFWPTLSRTVERLRATETLVRAEVNRSWQVVAESRGSQFVLPTQPLLALPEIAFRLAEWLRPFGFTAGQAEQMLAALSRPAGQEFLSATHRITHERDGLLLEPTPARPAYELVLTDWPDGPVTVAHQFTLTMEHLTKPADGPLPTGPDVVWLDADRLTLPLTIRPWQLGDRFRPLGLNGHKLVSDLLNDLKLSRPEREQTTVLLSGDQIAWVIGRRIDHRYRVTAETMRVVQLRLSQAAGS